MIATGGLLRITARRQDSLKPKAHKAHKHKKSKLKRTEVVVVKGKLKLLSASGLVAALGVLVLLVGMAMAALGYWPRHGFFSTPGGASIPGAAAAQETPPPDGDGGRSPGGVNTTSQPGPGLLTELLHRYLHSDRLKVWGPLVMGVGIFLFICANAVLHENRDRKTRLIRLRDVYSTVIELHGRRQPAGPSANPLSRLVNYVQSQSLEPRSRCYPAYLLSRGEGKGGAEQDSSRGGVFSVERDKPSAPSPSRRHSAGGGGQGEGGGDGGPGQREGVTSCSVSSLHVENLLLSSLSVSACRRCSLPAVTVATAPGLRQSCDSAEMTSSPEGSSRR